MAQSMPGMPGMPGGSAAPPAAQDGTAKMVEVDPLRCWWKSSVGGVRIGETFSVVLTCAVLQNDAVQIETDETRLGSSVVVMSPFETVRGSHPADIYSGDRRFFQYEYVLRLINPDNIGKDVPIPPMLLHYRVNSRVAANASLQGRDHLYVLPNLAIRVLSTVPTDATDIRDASNESFGIAESLGFRASVLEIVAITAIVLGSLMVLLSLVRLIVRQRKAKPAGERGVAESAILKRVSRELAEVRQETEAQGWNDALANRALAAARIAAAAAIGRPVGQSRKHRAQAGEGRVVIEGGRGRKSTIVSGGVTAADVTRALNRLPDEATPDQRQMLEDLATSLYTFTTAQYARETSFDRAALDEALKQAEGASGRLRSEQAWPKPQIRRWTTRSANVSSAS
jgi:hypothetical protein